MKRRCTLFLLLLLLAGFASCSPGHLGSNELAFVRDGHLWTIDPDGANAFEVVAQDTPVVGYSWSPTHQILTFRTLDDHFARTLAAKQLIVDPVTGQIGDAPSTINTVGIDGGNSIPVMPSSTDVQYSNPVWNTAGTRLLYRQEPTSSPHVPGNAFWWVSQNDQPEGIASKLLPGSDSRLSLSGTDSTAIGINRKGIFTVTLAGTNTRYLISGPLPGHPLPASLERVLWQPTHARPDILYANPQPKRTTKDFESGTPAVQLILHSMDGQDTTLTQCACTQFAWSPDGNAVLYSTGSKYTLININDKSSFTITADSNSVPYWSPNGRFLLLDGIHTLQLVSVANKQQRALLEDGDASSTQAPQSIAGVNALLQPVSNNVWAADSRHFLFLTHNRLLWDGHKLSSGKGLYTVTIDDRGQLQGNPVVVDTGNDTQASWSYQNDNISFLY